MAIKPSWAFRRCGLRPRTQRPLVDRKAVGTGSITIVLRRGRPDRAAFGHRSFRLTSVNALREALADLRERGVDLEDPGDEIGPEATGSPHIGVWFHDLDGYRWELSVQNGAVQ